MTHGLLALDLLWPTLLVAVLLPLLGKTRRGVVFGVSVPLEVAALPEVEATLRRYRVRTVVMIACILCVLLLLAAAGQTRAALVGSPLSVVIELAGAVILWERGRKVLLAYAGRVPVERSAELSNDGEGRVALGVTAASLLPLGAAALWLNAHWEEIPARYPRHWNAAGAVNGWGQRSLGSVYAPLLMAGLVIVFLVGMSFFLLRAPGPQARMRRKMLAPTAGIAWMIAALFCFLSLLPVLGMNETRFMLVFVAQMPVMLGLVVWMTWRSGFPSAIGRGAGAEAHDGTPDSAWRAGGLIYYNVSDASVLVPKRFGWGWTLNFARPAAWVYLSAAVLLIGAATVMASVLR